MHAMQCKQSFIFHLSSLCSLIFYNAMVDLSIVTFCGKNVDIDEEIAIIVDISIDSYEFDTFSRDYHVYMNEWPNPLIGGVLPCQVESGNHHDDNAVVLRKDSVVSRVIQKVGSLETSNFPLPSLVRLCSFYMYPHPQRTFALVS